MKVVYCGGWFNYPYAYDHRGIEQGMTSLGWDWSIVDSQKDRRGGEEIADEINTIKPDIVFHGNADSLGKGVCAHVDKSIVQVFCMFDYRRPGLLVTDDDWAEWMADVAYVDTVFVSAQNHTHLWEKHCKKVFYAPHACWIPEEGLQYNKNFDMPFIFIGGMHGSGPLAARAALINNIGAYTRIPLTIINGATQRERDEIWKHMPYYYYSSKVSLDVSHFWHSPGYSSGRSWYITTLGGCALTKRFPECEALFPTGTKWYFDTPEEGATLLEHLLKNPDIIEKTKETGSKYAWRNHNYHVRFSQMMRMIESGKQVEI
jgi:hypothetical protein